jgi:hypothetical protein
LKDVLTVDEHVTALESVVIRWGNDAMHLLLEGPPAPVPTPPPSEPGDPIPDPSPAPQEAAGRTTIRGQKRITGLDGWRALKAEIEPEITDDAEVDVTWQITKRRPE